MINYELAFLLGLSAFVYTTLLTAENKILNKPYQWLYKLFKTDERQEVGKPVHWLFMILLYCEQCVAGQWALWIGFCVYYYDSIFWGIIKHLLSIFVTIFIAAAIKLIYINKLEKHDRS